MRSFSFVVLNEWSFLTNHARVLLCITQNCTVRLREIAATLGISERGASGIVTDLAAAGYVIKDKNGRRNRYRVHTDLPLPEAVARQMTIGDVLEFLSNSAPLRMSPGTSEQCAPAVDGAGRAIPR